MIQSKYLMEMTPWWIIIKVIAVENETCKVLKTRDSLLVLTQEDYGRETRSKGANQLLLSNHGFMRISSFYIQLYQTSSLCETAIIRINSVANPTIAISDKVPLSHIVQSHMLSRYPDNIEVLLPVIANFMRMSAQI